MSDFIRQVFAGKTIGRILFNRQAALRCKDLKGEVLDAAGGGGGSYLRYIPNDAAVTRVDAKGGPGVDKVIDLNKKLPFVDRSFDAILFFNAIYIIRDRKQLFQEFRRILKDAGALFLSSSFIYNEMPEPHDYCRLTKEGLEEELHSAGFADVSVWRYGERFTAAASLLSPFFVFNTIRLFAYSLAVLADRCIPGSLKERHPAPLGYFSIARK
ncbi:MAG: methyltransferase domain-containing protein [Minisyncoccia bacterium]|jgi:SAM-dependent methyltransferase